MGNNLIVCGGTFDHFHRGHEEFLKYVFSLGKKVAIGITSDEYVRSQKLEVRNLKGIESFEKRKQSVLRFIASEKASGKTEVFKIDDLFGPTLSKDLLIDAIIVSEDTKKGAEIINSGRKELGLTSLKILVVSGIKAEDGKLISSKRIRSGEINKLGKQYIKPSWLSTDLVLPDDLRGELEKPFGVLDFDFSKPQGQLIVSVGDVTTKKLNQLGFEHKLSVIDFKVARKETHASFSDLGFSGDEKIIVAQNSAGQVTHDLFAKVAEIFKLNFDKRVILKIIGEEDLAVLPLILVAPLDTIIYYGQPSKGLVKIVVSEENKERAYNLLLKFRPI